MLEDVAFLVPDAALHGYRTEDLVDGCSEGFAAVQDDQDTLLDVKTTADEVGEQVHGDGLVLCGAIPEPERDLHALGADAERHDTAAALQLDTVEHQRRQPHIRERAGHQLRQMLAGAPHELTADSRLRRRTLRLSHGLTDRLARA